MPISAKITSPIGASQRLKKGGPNVTVSPQSSLSFGNMVATRMNVIAPSSAQLFTTNIASRLATASSSALPRSFGRRQTMSPSDVAAMRPMNPTKYLPMSLCAKL